MGACPCRPGTWEGLAEGSPSFAVWHTLTNLWLTWGEVPWESMFALNLRGFGEQAELLAGGPGPRDAESRLGARECLLRKWEPSSLLPN